MYPIKKSNHRHFSIVTDQLHFLKSKLYPSQGKTEQVIKTPINPAFKLSAVRKELQSLKNKVMHRRRKETQRLILGNKSFFEFSTFELMEYNFNENTHSNILEYLFDYRNNNDFGSKLLSRFIESINSESSIEFSRLIRKNKYTIEREKSVGNGRMDIFISDPVQKFLIVIENKIYAEVGRRDAVDETERPITQLKIYRNFVEHNYKSYKKLFILLSYTPIEEDHSPFIFTDYKNLYTILNSTTTDDTIVEQYKLLLHSLVHNITNKRATFEKIKSVQTNNDMDLNALEIINGVLRERN